MMMGFAWWFIALGALAALFVLWPLLSRKSARQRQLEELGDEVVGRIAFNDALFAEQLQELDDQLQLGEISEAQYQKLKSELEQQNQQDTAIETAAGRSGPAPWGRSLLLATALLLPLLGWFAYLQLGAAEDVRIQQLNDELVQLQQSGEFEAAHRVSRELYEVLQERLKKQPDNLNNRFLLARTAVEMRDFPLALESYRYILERQPNSPAVLGEMAQVLFIAAGNRFTPEVQQVFDRALALDPSNGELLGFAGLAAYQSGQFEAAISYWERGQALLQPEDPRYESWQGAIEQAQRHLGEVREKSDQPAAAERISLQVAVDVAEGVELPPQATVFVYARAWEGPKAPLAMQRLQASELPAVLTLDESMSMVPGMTMSRFPQLEIVARVSLSGSAEAQSGDWQGLLGPVEAKASDEPLKVLIDSQLP